MAETVGSLVDKLCIVELKIFHMAEHAERDDVTPPFRKDCREKVAVLEHQRDDLATEVTALLEAIGRRELAPKVYRQFKTYNDPRYRRPGPG